MKATEFIIDNVEEKLKNIGTKPRNFVAKNAMKTTSGAGAHRDKKKEQKQGDFKHKNQSVAEGLEDPKIPDIVFNTVKRLYQKNKIYDPGTLEALRQVINHHFSKPGATVDSAQSAILNIIEKRRNIASRDNYLDLTRFKEALRQGIDHKLKKLDVSEGEDPSTDFSQEATGDGQFDSMMKKVTQAPTAKERNAERIRQKRERQADSHQRAADVFGSNPVDKLSIRKEQDAAEAIGDIAQKRLGPDMNDPYEQGWFSNPNRDFNPYEKGTKEYQRWQAGQNERESQPNHYESVSVTEKAPPGEKAERMVKHIKKAYAKDGGLTDKERSIAYATAWKNHNK